MKSAQRSSARDRLIVALDFTALAPALRMAERLRGLVRTVKVGGALFTACGPDVIRRLRARGFHVMLDLKFFDIPSTVELSCRAAAGRGVALLTVHADGGGKMLEAAVRGARAGSRRASRPLVLAVTVLTSAGPAGASARVLRLAQAAVDAGCDGVVASAQEAAGLRRRFGHGLRIVCPGIRPAGQARQDQSRVATPGQALARGADLLVVGRPIITARDPRAAALAMLREMEDRHAC